MIHEGAAAAPLRQAAQASKGRFIWPTIRDPTAAQAFYVTINDESLPEVPRVVERDTYVYNERDPGGFKTYVKPGLKTYVDNLVYNEWKLQEPEVIISVTGGAVHFDLDARNKDVIMQGMMDGTR